MSIIDSIKNLFGGAQSKLPENLNSPTEVKTAAQDFAGQHSDTVNNAVDGIQDKIPGQAGDGVIDGAQEKFNSFGDKNNTPTSTPQQ